MKQQQPPALQVHMGQIVSEILADRKMKRNTLIEFLQTNKSNISRILDKADWRLSEVIAASEALQVNLFSFVAGAAGDKVKAQVLESTPLFRNNVLQREIDSITKQYNTEKKMRELLEENNRFLKEKVRKLELEGITASPKTTPKPKRALKAK